jgi:hypothetical protein
MALSACVAVLIALVASVSAIDSPCTACMAVAVRRAATAAPFDSAACARVLRRARPARRPASRLPRLRSHRSVAVTAAIKMPLRRG